MQNTKRLSRGATTWIAGLLVLFFAGDSQAETPTVSVVDPDGAPIQDYRWLVEEDRTHEIVPGDTCDDVESGDFSECLSIDFHRSYMPVVAEGHSGDPLPDLDPTRRYYLSILPHSAGTDSGVTIGGAGIAPGQTDVTVELNRLPLPTAQIRIFVFHDNYPINNAPDTPEEPGLEGFEIVLSDAAGRFGLPGGQMMQDAFGNPLGTTYNADGSVNNLGDGTIRSGPDGYATIKNLAPGKYGVEVVPPPGEGWIQTSTIEGSKTVDAWVKADEPPYFTEFGPPGPHVFIGFVRPFDELAGLPGATRTTVSGQIRNIHLTRPPAVGFHTGPETPDCWVGLNDLSVGLGRGVYATPCDEDSRFEIPDVPPGRYQLAIWDQNLDVIFGRYNFTVDTAGNCGETAGCDLFEVPVFPWFARVENYVFHDENENGVWDSGESPIPEVAVNLRFRDGTIYDSMPTDFGGAAPFDEVFPFFSWLVAEVDFARLKATGVRTIADAGGAIPADPLTTFDGVLNPYTPITELGPVLTKGFQAFLGETNVAQWGKASYGPEENGGISGIVYYATTRAENDPSLAAAEEWEPGIPYIQIALYRDSDEDGQVDDLDGDGEPTLADVDNHPFGWREGGVIGDEDFDHDGDGVFDAGDAIQITTTDSWDDNLPQGCQGENMLTGVPDDHCFDGLRNFNQVQSAVFDGGYAFDSYHPGGIASGSAPVDGLEAGTYIVEAGEHPVYETVKEEDRNVDFGDIYSTALLSPVATPPCVGDMHTVPSFMSFQTDSAGDPLPDFQTEDLVAAPFAGEERPLCDRKQVVLSGGMNAVADFFRFTETPKAAHLVGFILDDLSNEFDPNAATFGEKYAPPYMPVSIRDWRGREISRTYSDRWGRYNALVPSTYTANLPHASGMSPNMLITCMNSPADDPHYNPQYSQFCYTFQYMPGTTTYLDTPVVPVSAFTGANQAELDCSHPAGTPTVTAVSSPRVEPGDSVTVTGTDFGSGGELTVDGTALQVTTWSDTEITATVVDGTTTGQLTVVRGDTGAESAIGSTIIVGTPLGSVGRRPATIRDVWPQPDPDATPIQDAIDQADPGDLILIHPGTYEEMVIMWKPVRLQGFGANTIINAVNAPGNKLQAWRQKVQDLIDNGDVELLEAQQQQALEADGEEAGPLPTEEGAGIAVLARNSGPRPDRFGVDADGLPLAWIDGLSITGSDHGGGVVVNGFADDLQIANSRIYGNSGIYGGGIRLGHPELVLETNQGLEHQDADNNRIAIHHNRVSKNSSRFGAGAGVSLYTGSDDYRLEGNMICGNFTQANGAGVGHLGLSDNGEIIGNIIAFNQGFNQGISVTGGGLFVGGKAPVGGAGLSPGSGSVRVEANQLQGNHAGGGDGGGIRLESINGEETTRGNSGQWHSIEMVNNLIVNNVAGMAGAGVSLQDAANVSLLHNTIANNDSTATAGDAFPPGSPNASERQPAGIVAYAHSPELAEETSREGLPAYSSPRLDDNIIWHNRSFSFEIDTSQNPPVFGLVPDLDGGEAPVYWDLAVVGTGDANDQLDPRYCLLTDTAGYDASNISGDPAFVDPYVNSGPPSILYPEPKSGLQVMPAFDEGGNFIDVHFAPLHLAGDYHLQDGSAAINAGIDVGVSTDFDGDLRPANGAFDIGADERFSLVSPIAFIGCTTTSGGPTSSLWLLLVLLLLPLRLLRRTDRSRTQPDFGRTRRQPMEASSWIKLAILCGIGLGGAAVSQMARAQVKVQCPGDNNGDAVIDGQGNPQHPNARCMHLGAGDGYIRMADGRSMYIFGFADLTGVPPTQAMEAGMLAAAFPAPSIIVDEGDELYLTLTNVGMMVRPDLFDPHTVHYHGFPQAASIFDGLPESSVAVNMGSSLTYFYKQVEPGTYMYHCHVEATEHMQMGMLGNLYVRPAQNRLPDGTVLGSHVHSNPDYSSDRNDDDPTVGDTYVYNDGDGSTRYDVEYAIQLGSFDPAFHDASESVQPLPFASMEDKYAMVNGRGYPDTVSTQPPDPPAENGGVVSQLLHSRITAQQGERILLRFSNLNVTNFYTVTALGIPMKVVGRGARILRGGGHPDGTDFSYQTASVTLGGGEATDVLLDTTSVPPGRYFLYTTNFNYLSNGEDDFGGMMTEIIIN